MGLSALLYVCVCSVISDSFGTPWTKARQAPLSVKFSRQASLPLQESWSGLPFPTPEDLPTQGSCPSLAYPALAGGFFTIERPGKPLCYTEQPLYKIFQRICVSVKSLKPVLVQLLSGVLLFATPWTTACQASLSFTISQSLPKFMSWVSDAIQPYHLCCPLLLLPLVFPSSRVFSSDQVAKVLELQHQSFQCVFRVDFL